MKNNITLKEMINYLNTLKKLLGNFEYDMVHNIIFFNFDSFLYYINDMCSFSKNSNMSIKIILNTIEPYIPFDFDDKSINFLISRVIDDYDPESFQKLLIKRAKIDFIKSVKIASSNKEWQKIINNCKNIYEYRESNGLIYK